MEVMEDERVDIAWVQTIRWVIWYALWMLLWSGFEKMTENVVVFILVVG